MITNIWSENFKFTFSSKLKSYFSTNHSKTFSKKSIAFHMSNTKTNWHAAHSLNVAFCEIFMISSSYSLCIPLSDHFSQHTYRYECLSFGSSYGLWLFVRKWCVWDVRRYVSVCVCVCCVCWAHHKCSLSHTRAQSLWSIIMLSTHSKCGCIENDGCLSNVWFWPTSFFISLVSL